MSKHIPNLVTPTVYNDFLQIKKLTGDTKTPFPEYTTINERLGILAKAPIQQGESPTIKYLVIGDMGAYPTPRADGGYLTSVYDRESRWAGPFRMIPWVIRDEGNDLPVELREKFALRILKEQNGTMKWFYYGYRFDCNVNNIEMIRTTYKDGVATTIPFVPGMADLIPTPKQIPPDQATTTASDLIEVKKEIIITVTPWLVEELFNVGELLYGDRRAAIISEIGICTGIDRDIQTTTSGSASIKFKDAIAVQAIAMVSTNMELQFQTKGFDIEIVVGTNTPTLTAEPLDSGYMTDTQTVSLDPRVAFQTRISTQE